MEYFLPCTHFAIPSQVISSGLVYFIEELLDLLNHVIGGKPFIQIQVKGGSAMAFGDNQTRADEDWFFSL